MDPSASTSLTYFTMLSLCFFVLFLKSIWTLCNNENPSFFITPSSLKKCSRSISHRQQNTSQNTWCEMNAIMFYFITMHLKVIQVSTLLIICRIDEAPHKNKIPFYYLPSQYMPILSDNFTEFEIFENFRPYPSENSSNEHFSFIYMDNKYSSESYFGFLNLLFQRRFHRF